MNDFFQQYTVNVYRNCTFFCSHIFAYSARYLYWSTQPQPNFSNHQHLLFWFLSFFFAHSETVNVLVWSIALVSHVQYQGCIALSQANICRSHINVFGHMHMCMCSYTHTHAHTRAHNTHTHTHTHTHTRAQARVHSRALARTQVRSLFWRMLFVFHLLCENSAFKERGRAWGFFLCVCVCMCARACLFVRMLPTFRYTLAVRNDHVSYDFPYIRYVSKIGPSLFYLL